MRRAPREVWSALREDRACGISNSRSPHVRIATLPQRSDRVRCPGMTRVGLCLVFIALPALAQAPLPAGSAPPPIDLPHFPSRVHALVWRNWNLVEAERIAKLARLNQVVASRHAPEREVLHARRIRCEDLEQIPSASVDQCVRELQKRLRTAKSPEIQFVSEDDRHHSLAPRSECLANGASHLTPPVKRERSTSPAYGHPTHALTATCRCSYAQKTWPAQSALFHRRRGRGLRS